ncbi:MAG: hypothetical protein ACKO7D_06435 [Bacteroidota bacterium]
MKNTILFSLAIILLGCASSKKISDMNNENPIYSKAPKFATLGDNTQNSSQTTIYDAKLNGNTLVLSIGYTGGCATHTFDLVGSEMISKSLPPIRSINLIHNAKDEACKRAMYDTLFFDITNLAYKKEAGSVIKLNLAGWKEQLVYTYQ